MNRLPDSDLRRCIRRGFSRWEALVTLVCLLLLAALMLPGLQVARTPGRQAACFDHQHNIAVAVMNYLSRSDERLPNLRGDVEITVAAGGVSPLHRASWVVALLPGMDQRALYDRLLAWPGIPPAEDRANLPYASLTEQIVPGYTCPDSPQHQQPGGLSYVASAGYVLADEWRSAGSLTDGPNLTTFDWRNDVDDQRFDRVSLADQTVSRDAGVFLDLQGMDWPLRLSDFNDGVSSTLLFAENLDAGRWADTDLLSIGFGIPLAAVDRVPVQIGTGDPTQALLLTERFEVGPGRINWSGTQPSRLPRPSSNHPGGVVTTFGDGRSIFVNESIDDRVYAQLLTPSGTRHGQDVITTGQIGG